MSPQEAEQPEPPTDLHPARGWVRGAVILGIIVLIAVSVPFLPFANGGFTPETGTLASMTADQLAAEKLRQEIHNLTRQRSLVASLPTYASIATALVAVAGLVFTAFKFIEERKQQRLDSAREQQALLSQREMESLRRFDQAFAMTVTNLGSATPSLQASAALSLLTFLKPEYRRFSNQVFLVLLANLRVDHDRDVNKMLTWVFERSLRIQLEVPEEEDRHLTKDLTNVHLEGADLTEVQLLDETDIAFASLKGVDLHGARLFRSRGFGVRVEKAKLSEAMLDEIRWREAIGPGAHFHRTKMRSARLEKSDLRGAQFFQAEMQQAHFNGAHLEGAKFEEAVLTEAIFTGAHFDDAALASIASAKSWRKAHFDEVVRERIEAFSAASK